MALGTKDPYSEFLKDKLAKWEKRLEESTLEGYSHCWLQLIRYRHADSIYHQFKRTPKDGK